MRTLIYPDGRRRRRRIILIIVLLLIVFGETLAFALGIAALTPLTAAAGPFIAASVYAALGAVKVFFDLLDRILPPAVGEA